MKKLTLLIILGFMLLPGLVNASMDREVFNKLNPQQLLALVTDAESRGNSSIEGRNAVASVVLERNDRYRWGIKKIILQPRQFSPFNPEDKGFQRVKNIALNFNYFLKKRPSLQESYILAGMLLSGAMPRLKTIANHNVMHFATINCTNKWIKKMSVVTVLDGHKFMVEGQVIKTDYHAKGNIERPEKQIQYVFWMEETMKPFVSLL